MSTDGAQPLLSVRNLKKHFVQRTGFFQKTWKKAVDGVSFDIFPGRTMALVGESGSGKTTVGLMILDLLEPSSGEILYQGKPVTGRKGADYLALRRQMQVVFQDPYSSLNARMNVREILTEGMDLHKTGKDGRERAELAQQLMDRVGLPPDALDRYPHEFSGGQRQRIAIARALSVRPKFIICDEPTSALDVSVQSQVLNLLRKLQREEDLTYLFITHNLGVVEYLADEVCVMERGLIVERGPVEQIFDAPREEYTKRLLGSVPSLDPARRKIRETATAV
jgi:ABC-type oligopeptide transport system ATPase subunit